MKIIILAVLMAGALAQSSESIGGAAGLSHTCLLKSDRTVCFGNSEYGQGTGIKNLVNPRSLVSGGSHNCVIDDDGLWCWGYNEDGQTNVPQNLGKVISLATGVSHTCATDGEKVTCWGNNEYKQLEVPELSHPSQVVAGYYHTCALDDNGVKCWGYDYNGSTQPPESVGKPEQLYSGGYSNCAIRNNQGICWGAYIAPEIPSDIKDILKISLGNQHACAITKTGVRCWGDNGYGQTNVPEQLTAAEDIFAGSYHTCALAKGKPFCWGYKYYGQTIPVEEVQNPSGLSLGNGNSCVLDDGKVKCWGANYYGQSDDPGLTGVRFVASGASTTCAAGTFGVKCWGYLGDKSEYQVPSKIKDPDSIVMGANHFCASKQGVLTCWGNNRKGKASKPSGKKNVIAYGLNFSSTCFAIGSKIECKGDSDFGNPPTGLLNISQITVGSEHACALSDGQVKCWGSNAYKQLDVPPLTKVTKIRSTYYGNCALSDEGVTCWGGGQFRDSPSGLEGATDFALGGNHACAIINKEIRCWGNNEYGQSNAPESGKDKFLLFARGQR
jgi:alpha-tubulin suppressor-like RCC1 family protein